MIVPLRLGNYRNITNNSKHGAKNVAMRQDGVRELGPKVGTGGVLVICIFSASWEILELSGMSRGKGNRILEIVDTL